MATIIAEATDTAVEVTFTISNASGPVTGLTVAASCYDRARDGGDGNIWLQGAGPTWSTGKVTAALTEVGGGLYAGSLNVSSATARNLIVIYDYSGTETGVDSDQLILVDALANASASALATVDTNVDAVLVDTGTTIPATLGTLSTQASVDIIDSNVDAVLVDTGTTLPATLAGLATPGDAMTLSANAVNASALATDAVTEIRNSILADGTAFNGADVAAILVDTGTDIPARFSGIEGAGFLTGTDSLGAIRDQGDAAWVTGAGSSAGATADAVWDAIATSYNNAGSMGELLNGAGGAFTPAQVADAVWDEAIADHLGAGQAAQFLSDVLDDTAAIQPDAAAILADTAAMQPVVASNLDAPVSTRTAPADAQLVGSFQANAITAAALAADAGTEIAAAVDAALIAAHGAGSYQTATGFAVPGSAMALTGAAEVAVVDAVWDEAQASHVAPGSIGASVNAAGSGADAAAIADAVWDELAAGHTTPDSFGYFLDAQVSVAGGSGLDAAGVRTAIGLATANLDTQLGTIDANVDSILVDTTEGGAGPWTQGGAIDEAGVRSAIGMASANMDTQLGTLAIPGDEMALAAAAEAQLVDAVWDEPSAGHLTAGTEGFLQDQAATGGAGVTPLQIENAVWNAATADHATVDTMGKAVADSADVPDNIAATANRMYQAVRRYGPVLVQQPLAGKDEVHAGDLEVVLTIPVILDGNYSDLSDATTIEILLREPGSSTSVSKSGIGVTTQTGSYTSWTTDNTVFQTTGRWRVSALVTWPDATTKASDSYVIDVQSPLPVI